MPIKPNLFIVGAPKCGTTAWVKYLGDHPDIFFSKVKEPHFFSADLPHRRKVTTWDEYLCLFDQSGAAKIVGEASVRYLHSEVAAAKIREFNPDAKIIIFLRDQADYLISWHGQLLWNGADIISDFAEAWRLSSEDNTADEGCQVPNYRTEALFSHKVERYFAEFPPTQIRVFHFRDWTANPRGAYLEIMQFLGLNDDGRMDFQPVNEAKHHRTGFIKNLVREPPRFAAASIALLKKLMGRPTLGLAKLASRLNRRKGSSVCIDPALKEEIRAFFRNDNTLLEHRLWKAPVGEVRR